MSNSYYSPNKYNNSTNNNNDPDLTAAAIVIIVISIIGIILFVFQVSDAIEEGKRERANNLKKFTYVSNTSHHSSYSTSNSSNNSPGKSSSTTHKSSYSTQSKSADPSDYDIDGYYEDYKDEFENEEDAWDDFEDNDAWDDY